jgi:hypothetical protein
LIKVKRNSKILWETKIILRINALLHVSDHVLRQETTNKKCSDINQTKSKAIILFRLGKVGVSELIFGHKKN